MAAVLNCIEMVEQAKEHTHVYELGKSKLQRVIKFFFMGKTTLSTCLMTTAKKESNIQGTNCIKILQLVILTFCKHIQIMIKSTSLVMTWVDGAI